MLKIELIQDKKSKTINIDNEKYPISAAKLSKHQSTFTLSKTKRGKRPFKSKHMIHSNVQVFGSVFDSLIAQHDNRFSAL